jgi:hypothetical protein
VFCESRESSGEVKSSHELPNVVPNRNLFLEIAFALSFRCSNQLSYSVASGAATNEFLVVFAPAV